jgi:indole-3-glycerol phosphate synthase
MSYLEVLVDSTKARIDHLHASTDRDELEAAAAAADPPRPFRASLMTEEIGIIAEIKRATPSRGALAPDLDAGKTARAYAAGGAAAISVLTEPESFKGCLADLEAAKASDLPLLRKDFILDRSQIFESRAAGADAILLIVRLLGDDLKPLLETCENLGMDALVEVFDESDLERAFAAGASMIGVNHRDLRSFELDLDRTAKLAPRMEPGTTLVALSGVTSRQDIEALREAGVDAVLVGGALVVASDPAATLRTLRGQP